MRLHVSLQPGEGEMPSDFASRLAARACRDSLWDFCGDFGLDTQGIINAKREAVAALAALADVDLDALMREAFVRGETAHRFVHKGQKLGRVNLTRGRLRVCPFCIAEDVGRQSFRMAARPHRRSEWIIGAIHTCGVHRSELVDLHVVAQSGRSHETSIGLAEALPRLEHLQERALRRFQSRFETYVRDRLAGVPASPWLDQLPFYAALEMVRVVGAVSVHGPRVKLDALSGSETWTSEAAGFNILHSGEDGFRTLLTDLQAQFWRRRTPWGPTTMFGRLYQWLAHEVDDRAYEPVRRIMMDHVLRTLPVGPGDTMFGRDFRKRRLHSIHSASIEFGYTPKRLRKLLLDADLIGPETKELSDERVLLDAGVASAFIKEVASALKLGEAARYLNISRAHEQGILVHGDFVQPLVRRCSVRKIRGSIFRRSDLDRFLARLRRRASPVGPGQAHFVQIPKAARRACCDVASIVRLILERRLRVATLSSEPGFLSILVDVAEVKPLVIGQDHGGLRIQDLERALRTTSKVVRYLIGEGFLKSESVRNPVHNGLQTIVRPHELERFRAEFITIFNLAVSRRVHARTLRKELDAAGVRPVVENADVKLTLYRISDVP